MLSQVRKTVLIPTSFSNREDVLFQIWVKRFQLKWHLLALWLYPMSQLCARLEQDGCITELHRELAQTNLMW